MLSGHAIWDTGSFDLVLRADEPLCHRRLSDQERTRDLLGRQTTQESERERDTRLWRERRMTAREDEAQPVILHEFFFLLVIAGCCLFWELRGKLAFPRPAPQAIERAIARSRRDPGAGIGRQAIGRPPSQRHRERLLDRVFREVDV